MNILVIGKGGREHALVWKLKQSPRTERLFCAPGNAGTARDGATNVPIDHSEKDRLARFCSKEQIGLVVIGPEDPLAAGLADTLRKRAAWFKLTDTVFAALQTENVPEAALTKLTPLKDKAFSRDEFIWEIGKLLNADETNRFQELLLSHSRNVIKVFGPSQDAARIEASKVFAKELMRHADVPTSEFQIFDHPEPARTHIESRDYPVVVKADGLAAGKGVVVCRNNLEAVQAVRRIMTDAEFGDKAGRRIVVEKRLEGVEVSVLALVSGRTFLLLPPCQDHKAVNDGDKGPNTGGMGAYCPAPVATTELLVELEREVFFPTIHAMKRGRFPFQGVLFAGIMLTNQGPRVLEFNCRFGDPETQTILMRLKSDLVDLLEAVADERLQEFEDKIVWDLRPAVCVVLCSGGYPGKYTNGKPILGIEEAEKLKDVKVFHAGTKIDERNRIVTDGGRVLGVTALGRDLAQAKARAYEAVKKISFSGMHFRTDIADKALKQKPTPVPAEPPKLPPKFRRPGGDSGEKPS
jgi:phosphoribosylamine---glycine ligase